MPIAAAFIAPHPPFIIPEVGKGQEKTINATTEACLEISRRVRAIKPDLVVFASPHGAMYSDYFHIPSGTVAKGDFRSYGAGKVKLSAEHDGEFAETLASLALAEGVAAGPLGGRGASLDHGVMIPLYFIQKSLTDFKIARVSQSGLSFPDHYRLGQCVAEASRILGRKTVVVASGDLSHKLKADGPYGFAPEGPEFDRFATSAMAKGDFMAFLSCPPPFAEKAAECGLRSFILMAGALDGFETESELLSYEGPFGVGYAVASFIPTEQSPSRRFLAAFLESEKSRVAAARAAESPYAALARHALETRVATGTKPARPTGLPAELLENKAGVFVSLKKHGELRGCIGTISPATGCLADEILRNAQEAGLHDPRFEPVGAEELDSLVYSVDVLGASEPVPSADSLDPRVYGVIVSKGSRRGLLLPNLDGVDTAEEQIAIALRKAGIRPDEDYALERFKVERHK
ncbi:MAG: AmmeMemoRadiSam system protein A [Clostridiales Family XIII bacterium]|jgi:AmmeMemoRadiSam system protein A|nr:AmmeMemoRadiSam system protein A [Clostridiales Family XIII bacterium]